MELTVLWLIAALMAAFTAWLLKKGSAMRTLSEASVFLLLLSMMAVMFLSAAIYLYFPGFTTLIVLMAFNMVTMSVFLVPFLLTIFFGDRRLEDLHRGGGIGARTLIIGFAIAFVIMAEVFMGWTFAIASGELQATGGSGAVYFAFVSSSSSYWFIFTMAAEMILTFVAMRRRFPDGMGWIVGTQPLMDFFSPTAIDNHGWVDFSFLTSSAIMVVVLIYAVYYLRKNRNLSAATIGYIFCLILAYALMMTGILIWFIDRDALVFVLSVSFQMIIYFYVILEDKHLGSRRLPDNDLLPQMTVTGP